MPVKTSAAYTTRTETSHGEMTTPFERDIGDQAEALLAFSQSATPSVLTRVLRGQYDRIVLTGMGSSHFAALLSWRRLVDAGYPAWWVDSGQLLDSPRLITPGTLLIATSQSGASAEIVAMLESQDSIVRATTLVAITNDPASPLARRADGLMPLRSGGEATVSTKSYVNSLAAHLRIASILTAGPGQDAGDAVKVVDEFSPSPLLRAAAADLTTTPDGRLVYIGFGDHSATALYAALITKEAAKIPAEGYAGGQFRHGPLELAGPGLTAVLFGGNARVSPALRQLGSDLLASGSTVLAVGDFDLAGADQIAVPAGDALAQVAHGALVSQHLSVAIARARGITPGTFNYGSKVTTAL
jgi:glutamine---fructose-6-phosphate transaminase (isomerizing)